MTSNGYIPPPFGGFWARALCETVDGWILKPPFSIVLIALYIVLIPVLALTLLALNPGKGGMAFAFSIILFAILAAVCVLALLFSLRALYAGYFLSRHGATPGKMLMQLKVVKAHTGERLTFAEGFLRELAKIISLLPLGFGYVMAGWDPEKRALHDRICGTRVVRESPTTPPI